jgi:hypothetical protein
MKAITKAARVNTALQVIHHKIDGLLAGDALGEVRWCLTSTGEYTDKTSISVGI